MRRVAQWIVARQNQATKMALRLASFYVGYRILHHEVWETDTSEPLLIGLGLWLCGLPPALFLESLRKLANETEKSVEQATPEDEQPDRRDP